MASDTTRMLPGDWFDTNGAATTRDENGRPQDYG
jgi:hypothetical protein